MDYKFIIPVVVSTIAALFSILAYRRNRRFANENHLFEKKLDVYSLILNELNKLLIIYDNQINLGSVILRLQNTANDERTKELNDTSDKFDEVSDNFRAFCMSHSLLVPNNILTKIEKLIDKLYLSSTPRSNTITIPNIINYLSENYDELLGMSNDLINEMRKDLNIDELNTLLYKRLKK